jgi:hypothetical protein
MPDKGRAGHPLCRRTIASRSRYFPAVALPQIDSVADEL